MLPLLCGLLFALVAFVAVAAGAYFGLDRVERSRLEQEAEDAPEQAGLLLLLRSPRALRGTLNLIGDAGRVGFAVTALQLASAWLPGGEPDGGRSPLALAAAGAVLFVVLFFLAELPARLVGARNGMAVTRVLGRPLRRLVGLTSPLRALATRLGRKPAARHAPEMAALESPDAIDEEEFRELVDESTEAGVVQAGEQALIHKVLDFGDRRVRDVMTPYDRMFALADDMPVLDAAARVAERKYSRIPIYRRDSRRVVGVLYAKDLLPLRWGVAQAKPIKLLQRRPLFVVPAMRAQALLESFKRHRLHMAIVVDEHGRAVGLCTMEDLLEELVGPITDVAAERKGEEAPA